MKSLESWKSFCKTFSTYRTVHTGLKKYEIDEATADDALLFLLLQDHAAPAL
jgi:hypothetical protein